MLYPEHTSTDLLSHAYYRDPYFDFMAPLLHEAARLGDDKIVEILTTAGADVNFVNNVS